MWLPDKFTLDSHHHLLFRPGLKTHLLTDSSQLIATSILRKFISFPPSHHLTTISFSPRPDDVPLPKKSNWVDNKFKWHTPTISSGESINCLDQSQSMTMKHKWNMCQNYSTLYWHMSNTLKISLRSLLSINVIISSCETTIEYWYLHNSAKCGHHLTSHCV